VDQARSAGLRDTQQIEAILDVAASATDLAAIDVAKAKHKIIVLNGPGMLGTNEACTSVLVHYACDDGAPSHGNWRGDGQGTTLGFHHR
jgi:hypothetical protein